MEWATLIVLALTFGAILWYSYETRELRIATGRMAEETKKQAKASRQMAEEMEAQRIDAVQPTLVLLKTDFGPRNAPIDLKRVSADSDKVTLSVVRIHNFGVGLASDIVCKATFDGCNIEKTLPPLAPGYWIEADLWTDWQKRKQADQSQTGPPERIDIELRYRDTFGKPHVTTVQLTHGDQKEKYNYYVKAYKHKHLWEEQQS